MVLLITLGWSQPVSAQGIPEPPEEITINQLHFFMTPLGNRLQITEHYLLGNRGETPYTGNDQNATVAFPLPPDAENVQFEEVDRLNERYQIVDGILLDQLPIPFGEATLDVQFTYEIPYQARQTISRAFLLPVDAAVVMVMEEGVAVESSQLSSMGPLSAEPPRVNAYAMRRPLTAGESLTLTLVPPASASTGRTDAGGISWEIGLGALALALALAVAFALRRQGGAPLPPLPDESRPLVEALARLEEAYESGDLSEEAYERQRDALRAELRASLSEAWSDDRDS